MAVTTNRRGSIFEIVIDNPPVNALSSAVRRGLLAALEQAREDSGVTAIVVSGAGRGFSAGADIAEFDAAPTPPLLPQLFAAFEANEKPIVAAIHGEVLGGGLELALACHYRVASASAWLGLPEVRLGLLPGAGGTQRLPRLTGVEQALKMIAGGDPVSGWDAAAIGLVDLVVDVEELAGVAAKFALGLTCPRRTGDLPVVAEAGVFDRFMADNERKIVGLDAPKACIEAVKGAVELPLAEGLAQEEALFHRLLAGPQSRALRHAFFAERLAPRVEGVPHDLAPRPILSVAVIGAGTMGGGIAMNFLSAGLPVTILDRTAEALEKGVGIIASNYQASVARGRLSADAAKRAMALLTPALDYSDLRDCDLIVEAVFEDMAVKIETFRRLDAVARPGAILASNTSFLDIDDLAAETGRPQDVLGLHFFSPANVMKLLEVVRGERTAPDVLATAMVLARRIGKMPVVSRVCDGFIGNRILFKRQKQAEAVVLEGASPEQVDKPHLAMGMPMGPFQMADLAGLDVGWHRDPSRVDNLRDALCAIGRFGQKSRAGFYDYDDKRRSLPSPRVAEAIDAYRRIRKVQPRAIGDEEIFVRTVYVMVNEAARIIEEGIAQRPSDIDVVWLHGYGWPRATGGLVHWANEIGLSRIVGGLERYTARLGGDFDISPLLIECAREGRPLALPS